MLWEDPDIRAQVLVIELLGGEVAELILHPDHPSLGANMIRSRPTHSPRSLSPLRLVAALIKYCEAEAAALIRANIDIVRALVEELIERGILTGDQIDVIIAREVAVKALANERARRAVLKIVENNAAGFAAHGLED